MKAELRHFYYHIVMHVFERGELGLAALGIFEESLRGPKVLIG